jgi:hypothetical protein
VALRALEAVETPVPVADTLGRAAAGGLGVSRAGTNCAVWNRMLDQIRSTACSSAASA